MKKRLKRIQVFLVIVISFFVLGFTAYFHYCNLAGVDFHSPDLSFENPDQDNLLIDHLNELKIFGSNGLSDVFLLTRNILEQLPLIGFEKPSLEQNTVTLRC